MMKKNQRKSLKVLGLNLLWVMGCLTATATESLELLDEEGLQAEAQAIATHFQTWESVKASSEKKEEAKSFLRSKGIIVEDRYKQSDIDRAWSRSLRAVTRNVVRTNRMEYKFNDDAEATLHSHGTGTGTGTLIDVGIPELRGRVVATCAHCVLPHFSRDDGASSTAAAIDNKISSIKYNGTHYFYFGPGNWSSLSITAECKKGQTADIPITNIYFLTYDQDGKKYYDICIVILERPVKDNNEIVSGIDLKQLNVITDSINMGQEDPFHICWKNSNNFHPLVIGYGDTGIYKEQKSFSYLDQETGDFITGFGIKKAIVLRGIDLNFTDYRQNMKACRCAQYLKAEAEVENIKLQYTLKRYMERGFSIERRLENVETKTQSEFVKKELESMLKDTSKAVEEAKNSLNRGRTMAPFFAGSQAGSGFSGSLVFRVKKDVEDNEDNENKNYDVVGIFSGPLFTEEIKSFIKNVADDYRKWSLNSLKRSIEDMKNKVGDDYKQFSDGLKCFIQDMRGTAGDDHEWFSDNLKYSIEDVRNIAGDDCEWFLNNLKRVIENKDLVDIIDNIGLSDLQRLVGI
ncbi:MAG: hypothetical protein LBB11_01220 [Puniceicoccales bacterium]|jgi:hypothetical protein|nr:hypothetical protein [Puniceicoccales bacterium]